MCGSKCSGLPHCTPSTEASPVSDHDAPSGGHAIPTDDDIHTRWTTLDTVQGVYEIRAVPHSSVIETAVEATGADDGELVLEYLRNSTPQIVMRAASDRHERASIAYLSPIIASINNKRMETGWNAAHVAEFGPTAQKPSGDSWLEDENDDDDDRPTPSD